VLKVKTLKHYGVRVTTERNGFILPVYNFSGELSGIKVLTIHANDGTKIESRTIPRSVNLEHPLNPL
jgi:hypothetical protein